MGSFYTNYLLREKKLGRSQCINLYKNYFEEKNILYLNISNSGYSNIASKEEPCKINKNIVTNKNVFYSGNYGTPH